MALRMSIRPVHTSVSTRILIYLMKEELMRHALSLRLLITMLVCLIPIYRSEAATSPSPAPALSAPQISAILMRLPLQFEANQGQVDEPVKFLARGKGYNLFLTPSESVLVLTGREASSVKRQA